MLQKILADSGYDTLSYRMPDTHGTYCLGVRTTNIGVLFSHVLNMINSSTDLHGLSDAFRLMRIDNMGVDSVLYFPTVPYKALNVCQYEYLPDEDGTAYTCGSDYRVEHIDGYYICANHRH